MTTSTGVYLLIIGFVVVKYAYCLCSFKMQIIYYTLMQ